MDTNTLACICYYPPVTTGPMEGVRSIVNIPQDKVNVGTKGHIDHGTPPLKGIVETDLIRSNAYSRAATWASITNNDWVIPMARQYGRTTMFMNKIRAMAAGLGLGFAENNLEPIRINQGYTYPTGRMQKQYGSSSFKQNQRKQRKGK